MASQIIQSNPSLIHLNLEKLSNVPEHGEQILEALCSSNIKLTYLNLAKNESWWTRAEYCNLFNTFLNTQDRISDYNLNFNKFSSQFTETILSTIINKTELTQHIREVYFQGSMNFDENWSIEALADIIQRAPKLDSVHITG